MNCPSLLLDDSAAYHLRVCHHSLAQKIASGNAAIIWNICVGLRTNHSAVGKSRTSESQCLREKGLRQSGNRKPCLPRQVGFETHRQWSLWLQDRNLAISLKPYMRYSRSRLDERLVRLTKKHS